MGIASATRAVQLLFKPYEINTGEINDFAAIARDLKIAYLWGKVFAIGALISCAGTLASIAFRSIPAVSVFGCVFAISIIAGTRLMNFHKNLTSSHPYSTYLGPLLQIMDAALFDWGRGVPRITNNRITIDLKADFETNRNNLHSICAKLPHSFVDPRISKTTRITGLVPSHGLYYYDESIFAKFKVLLEKSWTFALQQENIIDYVRASHLCVWIEGSLGGNVTDNLTLETFTFDQGKINLPRYLKKATDKDPELKAMMSSKSTTHKDLLLRIIQKFSPHQDGFSLQEIRNRTATIKKWFHFERNLEEFYNSINLLKALGNSPDESVLRNVFAPPIIPEGVTLDNQLTRRIAAAGIQLIGCHVKIEEDRNRPSDVIAFVQSTPQIGSIVIKQNDVIDEAMSQQMNIELKRNRAMLPVMYMGGSDQEDEK